MRMSVRPYRFLALVATLLLVVALAYSSKVEDGSTEYVTISGCEKLRDSPQIVPDRRYWTQVRDAYVATVGKDQSTLVSWPLDPSSPFSGFVVPIEVRVTTENGMGRGVYAAAPITKGSPVWNASYQAIFADETSFRNYLSSISWEQACDILQWAYAFELDHDQKIGVGVCLDESSLFNHGNESVANVGYPDPTSSRCVALRDIDVGEELLQDYDSFEEDLEWFDDLVMVGWGDPLSDFVEKKEEL